MEETTGNPEVSLLNPWPTIVAKCVVPGHEVYDGEIDILAQEGVDSDVFAQDAPGLRWLLDKIDVFAQDAPGLRWLLDKINAKVNTYFDNFTKVERCSLRPGNGSQQSRRSRERCVWVTKNGTKWAFECGQNSKIGLS